MLIFTPIKNWCSNNWNWIIILSVIVYGLFYTIDMVIKWIYLHYTSSGKVALVAAFVRKQERELFTEALITANKNNDITTFDILLKQKSCQIKEQNITLFNKWLKKELGYEESVEEELV